MKLLRSLMVTAAMVTTVCCLLQAQDLKLTTEEQKNQDIAFVEFHDMLQYGHLELAEQYLAPGYIQHNPNVPQGRDGFVQYMSRLRKPEPIQTEWKTKPSLMITSGDFVILMSAMPRNGTSPVVPVCVGR